MNIAYLHKRKLSATTPKVKKPDENDLFRRNMILKEINREYARHKDELTAHNITEAQFITEMKKRLL